MIELTKKSPISGVPVTMSINTTEIKIDQWNNHSYNSRPLVQDFFTECSEEEREFILTGILPSEWSLLFGKGTNE